MNGFTFVQRLAVSLAAAGLCVPQMALAATPLNHQPPVIADVRLNEGGVLIGQVVTPHGVAVPDTDVLLGSGDQAVNTVKSDQNGHFTFAGLSNGVYQVSTAGGQQVYRLWTAETAPPAAQPHAMLVADTVRGQQGMRTFRNLMANPWVVAAIIATAVAIPVAIHNSKKPSSP